MTDKAAHRAQVVADLVALAKTASPDILKAISCFDSQAVAGDDVKHLAALQELWTTYDCRLHRQPDNLRYPSEPIKLASYAVDGQSDILSAYCNVILLIADLEDGNMGYMDYRWENSPGQVWFKNLPDRFCGPLMAGLEVLIGERSDFENDFWAGERALKKTDV